MRRVLATIGDRCVQLEVLRGFVRRCRVADQIQIGKDFRIVHLEHLVRPNLEDVAFFTPGSIVATAK